MASPYEGLPPDDEKRWLMIYPTYINSRKTVADGRRIGKTKAVDNPTCNEIHDVLASQGLQVKVEYCDTASYMGTSMPVEYQLKPPVLQPNKHFPREWCKDPAMGGRVRVRLRDKDGHLVSDVLTSKKEVLMFVSEMIPKLKVRQSAGYRGGAEGGGGGAGKAKSKGKKKK